ncbi:MAG: hypothetical protein ACK4NF_05090, partial [Planctomycetota bacterium]
MKKRGIFLIFILGIICILLAIVFVFYTVSNIAQKIVSFYHFRIKSQFAAQSGLEFAYVNMRSHLNNTPILSITHPFYYKGEINNLQTWDYTDINRNNFPDTTGVDIDDALYPSFMVDNEIHKNNIKKFSYSGIAEDSTEFMSVYKLKIIDLSSTVFIGEISSGTKNFLNNLSVVLNYPVFLGDILFTIAIEKNKIESFDTIKDVLQYPQAAILANFLSLDSWQLRDMVFPQRGAVDKEIVPSGHDFLLKSLDNIRLENRAPLNINLVHPLLIKANLYNLTANILVENPDYNIDVPSNISLDEAIKIFTNPAQLIKYATKVKSKNLPKLGYLKNYKVDNEKIDKLVSLIVQERAKIPFDSYNSFYNFLIKTTKETSLSQLDIDIIFANINPQTYLHKMNLDKSLKIKIDKTDLTNQTLEFIFFSPGKFYVESSGYLINKKSGEVEAKETITASFSTSEILHFTTQQDFDSGYVTFEASTKLFRGISSGPFSSTLRKSRLKPRKNMPGFISLGIVSNGITTDEITYCDTFQYPEPDVGKQDESEYILFNDGVYSSSEYPFKIPVEKNFPLLDFQDFFGVKYSCDLFKNTALERACGKITKGTFCFWIKPNYNIQNSMRIRTIVYIESTDPKFEATENINYVDSFLLSFVPVNFVKEMVKQYFPLFAPYTTYTLATPFFLWTPKVNPTYLSLITSESEVIEEGEWTHICVQWDSTKTIERRLGAKIIVNGKDKTFLFGNDYSTDY